MSVVVASMMRNEAGRFLRPVLDVWNSFASQVVVLDDGSTDDTVHVAKAKGAYVVERSSFEEAAWGEEAPVRRQLFELAWDVSKVDDWIFILDADMIPAKDPRGLLGDSTSSTVAFVLYDLWDFDPLVYRSDGYWQGHNHHRTWMVRKTREAPKWEWSERGVHCGHLPLNFPTESTLLAPRPYGLLHLGYMYEELREEKYIAYASIAEQLTEHERKHAISILDPNPTLKKLEFKPDYMI